MNKARRKELERAIEMLLAAQSIIDACMDDEQQAFDNLPDGIQYSERGEMMEEYIDNMELAISDIDIAVDDIREVTEV